MDGKMKVFLGILVLGLVLAGAGFVLDRTVSARGVVSQPVAPPGGNSPAKTPAPQTATPTLISFEYGMWGEAQALSIDVVCSGEDISSCVTATGQPPVLDRLLPADLNGRVLDCELGSRCQEVPMEAAGDYRFLVITPLPP